MNNWVFDVRSRPFFLLIGLFALVTLFASYGTATQADTALSNVAYNIGNKNNTLDLIMELTTEFGDVYYMLGFGILLLVIRRTRRIGLSIMISLVIVTIITGYAKCAIDRDRPELEYLGGALSIEPSPDTFSLFCDGGYNSSYPSGHAARAAVFGLILGVSLYRSIGAPAYLLLLYPILVSVSRVYILHHFPTDVVGGVILGFLIAGIISKKTRLHEPYQDSKTQGFK